MDAFFGLLWDFIYYSWFFWVLLILWPIAHSTWIGWRQKLFEHKIKWAMLEIMIPREIKTSPKAMEQIFTQLHSFKNYPGNVKEYWWEGEVTLWHSFEIVGMDGEVHFYVRTPRQYKDLVEAAFFAYYSDVEIVPAEDYMKRWPKNVVELYSKGYRMWGTELVLSKSSAYPIRNYTDFESPDENKQYDPMSGFIELLSKLDKDQFAAVQILCWPVAGDHPHDKHLFHEYQEEVIKVRERKEEIAQHAGGGAKLKFHGILPTLEEAAHEEEPVLKKVIMSRTPGEVDILTAMDENLARPMFGVNIRYIYTSPFATYSEAFPRRALFGAFNQYGATDINKFKHNKSAQSRGKLWESPFIFPDIRTEYRRQRLWHDFIHREIPPHMFMTRLLTSFVLNWYFGTEYIHLNTRSLATIWHPPTHQILTGPHIRRIESKKAGPPAGIEIFGDEEDIQKFT